MTQTSLSEGVYTYNIQVVMPGFNSGEPELSGKQALYQCR